jgi:hypothetical protein
MEITMNFKKELVKLGNSNPELRPHIRKVLASLKARQHSQEDLDSSRHSSSKRHLRDIFATIRFPRAKAPSRRDIVKEVSIYWSPRQQKLDPTMMGGSKDVTKLVVEGLLNKATTDWYHVHASSARKKLEALVLSLVGGTIGRNMAQNIGHKVGPAGAVGHQRWGQIFDPRYARGLIDLGELIKWLKDPSQSLPQGAEDARDPILTWLVAYYDARIKYGKDLYSLYHSKVAKEVAHTVDTYQG